jgi:hypothetical protein
MIKCLLQNNPSHIILQFRNMLAHNFIIFIFYSLFSENTLDNGVSEYLLKMFFKPADVEFIFCMPNRMY